MTPLIHKKVPLDKKSLLLDDSETEHEYNDRSDYDRSDYDRSDYNSDYDSDDDNYRRRRSSSNKGGYDESDAMNMEIEDHIDLMSDELRAIDISNRKSRDELHMNMLLDLLDASVHKLRTIFATKFEVQRNLPKAMESNFGIASTTKDDATTYALSPNTSILFNGTATSKITEFKPENTSSAKDEAILSDISGSLFSSVFKSIRRDLNSDSEEEEVSHLIDDNLFIIF
eukprot:Awhi_evm1s9304